MDYLFLIFALSVAVVAVFILMHKDSKKKEDAGSKSHTVIISNKKTRLEATNKKPGSESSDKLYADLHHMWVCSRCETINDSSLKCCVACGAEKI